MPFVENLDEFLDPGDFADMAVYTPQGGSASTVNVIFDGAYMETLNVEDSGPAAHGKAADFAGVRQGDALRVRATDYFIRDKRPDGQGWITLKLELQ
jgi:hypothetical protein